MLYCPYRTKTMENRQDTFAYDEDGKQINSGTVFKGEDVFAECLKEQCAVWVDERCTRAR